jgi:hypothetical protein
MPGKDFLPDGDAVFNPWQANYVGRIVATPADYGVTPAQVTELQALQADWALKYPAHIAAQSAARAAAESKDASRGSFETGIRSLTRQIQARPATTGAQREELGITVPDTEPTPRPTISTVPIVGFKTLRGGVIEASVRVEEDQTRPSMHPAADVIECKYILVPTGELPPDKPEACPKTQASKKAQFQIQAGIENAGKRFYGFFRWANQSNPANNGPWSDAQTVVIA